MGGMPQQAKAASRSAKGAAGLDIAAIAARQLQVTFELFGRRWRDVVHYAAHGVRAEADLACAFEHFDPLEAAQRGMGVGSVVPIRRIGERQAVFQEQDFA